MRFTLRHWCLALGLSIALHTGVSVVVSGTDDEILIERGAGDPVLVASDLAAAVSAANSEDVTEPTEPVTEPTEPVTEAQEAQEVEAEPVEPEAAENAPEVQPDVAAPQAEPEEPDQVDPDVAQPPEVDRQEDQARAREAETPDPQQTPTDVDVESADSVNPDFIKPPEAEEAQEADQTDTADAPKPEELSPELTKLIAAPLPKPKPAPPPKQETVEPVKKAKPKPTRKAKQKPRQQRQNSGSNKVAQPNRKPGDKGRNRNTTGRANMSNYMGRIASRLHRQKRYPRAAQRKKIQGTVVVSFTIRRNGSVAGVRLARRSGHAVLDQEVLAMVRRASPFPPFPANAGRNAITVTVPVSFRAR